MELKKHVVKGMAWTFAEKALTAVFQMFVGLVLMNFLFPDDYGMIYPIRHYFPDIKGEPPARYRYSWSSHRYVRYSWTAAFPQR